MASLSDFVRELTRRRVFRVATVYAVAAWLVIQIAATVQPFLRLPAVVITAIIFVAALGFPIAIGLGWAFDVTDAGVERTRANPAGAAAAASTVADRPRSIMRRAGVMVAFLIIICISVVAGLRATRHFAAQAATPLVAVLPFSNFGDAKDQYFADGMTDDVITALSKVTGLNVISRTSAAVFRTGGKTVPQIAQDLGASAVVEGSVQRSGDSIRVEVQLIDGRSDQHIWSARYDRLFSDVFGVQAELSSAIARAMSVRISPQARARLAHRPTENLVAYDLYMRAMQSTRSERVALLERAIAADTAFALAYASLGRAYADAAFSGKKISGDDAGNASRAAQTALRLDPDLADGYVTRGTLAWRREVGFQHEAAAADLHRALALNPSLVSAHEGLGALYAHVGLTDRALAEFDTVTTLDPGNGFAAIRIPRMLMYKGKYRQAVALLEPLRNDWQYPLALWFAGRHDEALKDLEVRPTNDADVNAVRALVFASAGRTTDALNAIAAVSGSDQTISHFHHASYLVACAYAVLKDPSNALLWLEKTARGGMPNYQLFRDDHNLDNLRRDPRFENFLSQQKQEFRHLSEVL